MRRTLHLGPSSIVRLFGLGKRRDDPPPILKRDPSRIGIPQVDELRDLVRLRDARSELLLVTHRHLLRIHSPHRVHLSARSHVRREQRKVLEQHALLALAEAECEGGRHVDLRCGRGDVHVPWGRVGRELLGTHEHPREVARGPLGVITCDGAQDYVWPYSGGLLLQFFALCEVFLLR